MMMMNVMGAMRLSSPTASAPTRASTLRTSWRSALAASPKPEETLRVIYPSYFEFIVVFCIQERSYVL